MTLKQLEAFYWAATAASFAVAAQRVHLSVSSLSKRIAELEGSLGQALFSRAGHRAALTDAGHRLLPLAQALLAQARQLREQMAAPVTLAGPCRLGVDELGALTWLSRAVAAVSRAHPGLLVEPFVDGHEALQRRVKAGELDFAVLAGRAAPPALLAHELAQARWAWCASPTLLQRRRTLDAALLAQHPLLALPTHAGLSLLQDDALAALQATALRRVETRHWGALAGLLLDGAGIGLLPRAWALALEGQGRLRLLRTALPLPAVPYTLQQRRDDPRALLPALRQVLAANADPGLLPSLF